MNQRLFSESWPRVHLGRRYYAPVDIVLWMMFKDRSPAEMEKYRRQIDMEKQMLIRSLLGQAIDSKILYVAFKSMKPEELAQFEERASEVIDPRLNLPLMKR